jgi:hypothetical protein
MRARCAGHSDGIPNWGTHRARPNAVTAIKAAAAGANASSPNARDCSDARSLQSPRWVNNSPDSTTVYLISFYFYCQREPDEPDLIRSVLKLAQESA